LGVRWLGKLRWMVSISTLDFFMFHHSHNEKDFIHVHNMVE
jgi:hypothetical protein